MPTVAITDYTFPNLDIERSILEPLGIEIVHGQCKTPELLIPLVENVDAVITQFAPVNAVVIEAMKRSKVIVRYGIGVDNVDLQAAKSRGIPVCNIPDYCIDEVADHTLAFILATTRQVVPNCLKFSSIAAMSHAAITTPKNLVPAAVPMNTPHSSMQRV